MSYLTIKCPIGRAVTDNAILRAIEHRVLLVSKMMHQGSHDNDDDDDDDDYNDDKQWKTRCDNNKQPSPCGHS